VLWSFGSRENKTC